MNDHWGDIVSEKTKEFGEIVIGIDPVPADIPLVFAQRSNDVLECLDRYVEFVLGAASGLTGFVKFQSAYFEAYGSRGLGSLAKAIAQAHRKKMGVILDAKRGDIGSTAAAYATAYLTPRAIGNSDLEVDCMTVNPFLGPDSLEPFVACSQRFGKGLFILAKTSNPGAGWIQDGSIDGVRVSDRTAQLIRGWADQTRGASGLSSIGAVVGATFPDDGRRLRGLMPDSVLLLPGIGNQGGNPGAVAPLRRASQDGILIPVSRGITKVTDLGISEESYGALIVERMTSLRASLG